MKPSDDETERELLSGVSSGIGAVLEHGDRLEIHTHSGGKFEGSVEDCNLAGVVIRTTEERLFFVSMSGIEYAEIFEAADEGDGEETEDEASVPDAAAPTTGEGVTPINTRAA